MTTPNRIKLLISPREAEILMGILTEHITFLEDEGDNVNDLCPALREQYEEVKHLLGYIEEASLD